jgi:hypothetical protein
MPGPAIALGAGMIGSSLVGASGARAAGKAQMAASRRAGEANLQGTRESIASQEKMFGISKELMDPFREAGLTGMEQMMALGGMSGPDAQREAMQGIQDSPEFNMLMDQSRQGLLSGASATGGLRGGDTQRAMAELSPNLLMGLADRQYGRLTGLTNLGQASAAGQAGSADVLGANLGRTHQMGGQLQAQAHTQYGQARAGSSLGQAKAIGDGIKGLSQIYAANSMGLYD